MPLKIRFPTLMFYHAKNTDFEMKFFTTSDYGKFTSEIIHAKRKSINGKI